MNLINVSSNSRLDAQAAVRALRQRKSSLTDDEVDLILSVARSHYAWQQREVPLEMLLKIYDIAKWGPTSMNSSPARFVFVASQPAKQRLAKALKHKNIDKMMAAPVTAIVAYDLDFWRHLPKLFPHEDRRSHFEGQSDYIQETAFRNSTLQGAYFMIATRSLGLDVGPMSGFSNEIVDAEFFRDTSIKSNFLCNLGYGDEQALFQRLPRFAFDEVCSLE
ncbi:malonic semialdehyde reductase [Corticibacterium sp. UT-5YL-CI-8]|nr:malonic semialdehyde reductase [Tianweitania sp. UT-5YL-CI-8]